jgi:hypothetical protein
MNASPARSSVFLTVLHYTAARAALFGMVSVVLMIVMQSYVAYINMSVERPPIGTPEGLPSMIPIAWFLIGLVMLMVFFILALMVGGLVALAVPSVAHSAWLSIVASVVVCLPILSPTYFLLTQAIYSGANPQLTSTTDYVSYFVIPALSLVGVALLTGNQVRKVLGMVA